EVDHRNRGRVDEESGDRVKHGGVARLQIVGLAQREPFGRKPAHGSRSRTCANSRAASLQVGSNAAAARERAASAARSAGSKISRRSAAASDSTSSGGT